MRSMLGLLRAVASELLDLYAPVRCAACDAVFPSSPPLCASCRSTLDRSTDPPPHVRAAYEHCGALVRAIHRAKYGNDPSIARALGTLLIPLVTGEPVDLIVPVPLHPRRMASRGFNQSAELAAALVAPLGASLRCDVVRRARDTPSQTHLDRAARHANVDGAFVLHHDATVHARRVLLVDDVVTTGATLHTLRAVLLAAGAETVRAVVLARAPLWMTPTATGT